MQTCALPISSGRRREGRPALPSIRPPATSNGGAPPVIIVLFLLLFILIGCGMSIWLAMGISGVLYILLQGAISLRLVASSMIVGELGSASGRESVCQYV